VIIPRSTDPSRVYVPRAALARPLSNGPLSPRTLLSYSHVHDMRHTWRGYRELCAYRLGKVKAESSARSANP
jgi:hypothetical protein